MTIRDLDINTVVCDNCGKNVPATQQDTAPDFGWAFDPRTLGYYGGFDDHCFSENDPLEVVMCHDCVASLIEAFPAFAKHAHRGGHPAVSWSSSSGTCTDVKPCCKYCWGWESYTNEEGKKVYITYTVNDSYEWQFDHMQIQ